jgi:hypothetical protein
MSQKFRGACQCGAVQFRIEGEFAAFFLCHCSRCRKDTGSAHAANLFSSTAVLDWLSGRDNIKTYRLPHTRHRKSFCIECGAALPTQEGGELVVPAGCLDTDVDVRPNAHICYGSRAKWDERLDDIPKIEGLPILSR